MTTLIIEDNTITSNNGIVLINSTSTFTSTTTTSVAKNVNNTVNITPTQLTVAGGIAVGTTTTASKITGLVRPVLTTDATSKAYVDSRAGASAAGSSTQVQYNDDGIFGASSDFVFSSNTLTVNGIVQGGSLVTPSTTITGNSIAVTGGNLIVSIPIDSSGNIVTGLSAPTVSSDAANKTYVDSTLSISGSGPGAPPLSIQINNENAFSGTNSLKYTDNILNTDGMNTNSIRFIKSDNIMSMRGREIDIYSTVYEVAGVATSTLIIGTGVSGGGLGLGTSIKITSDGNVLIAGAPEANSFNGGIIVFVRNASGVDNWIQYGNKLFPTEDTGGPEFGLSVDSSEDGLTIVGGGPNSDSVWIFNRSTDANSAYLEVGVTIVGTGGTGTTKLGISVAMSPDGTLMAAGGSEDNTNVGAVWLFENIAGTWTQKGNKLVGTGGTGTSNQGYSVSMSQGANSKYTLVVGAPGDNTNVGAIWIFEGGGVGDSTPWTQIGSKITYTGTQILANFGWSVSLSSIGDKAAIGGKVYNTNGGTWIFNRDVTGAWTQYGSVLVGTGNTGAALQGNSVKIAPDGLSVVVGAPADNTNVGAVWVFSNNNGTWVQNGNKIRISGLSSAYKVGYGVSMDGYGTLVAGAPNIAGITDGGFYTIKPVTNAGSMLTINGSLNVEGTASIPSLDFSTSNINVNTVLTSQLTLGNWKGYGNVDTDTGGSGIASKSGVITISHGMAIDSVVVNGLTSLTTLGVTNTLTTNSTTSIVDLIGNNLYTIGNTSIIGTVLIPFIANSVNFTNGVSASVLITPAVTINTYISSTVSGDYTFDASTGNVFINGDLIIAGDLITSTPIFNSSVNTFVATVSGATTTLSTNSDSLKATTMLATTLSGNTVFTNTLNPNGSSALNMLGSVTMTGYLYSGSITSSGYLYSGAANVNTLNITNNMIVGGNYNIYGQLAINNVVTISGNETITNLLTVNSNVTASTFTTDGSNGLLGAVSVSGAAILETTTVSTLGTSNATIAACNVGVLASFNNLTVPTLNISSAVVNGTTIIGGLLTFNGRTRADVIVNSGQPGYLLEYKRSTVISEPLIGRYYIQQNPNTSNEQFQTFQYYVGSTLTNMQSFHLPSGVWMLNFSVPIYSFATSISSSKTPIVGQYGVLFNVINSANQNILYSSGLVFNVATPTNNSRVTSLINATTMNLTFPYSTANDIDIVFQASVKKRITPSDDNNVFVMLGIYSDDISSPYLSMNIDCSFTRIA